MTRRYDHVPDWFMRIMTAPERWMANYLQKRGWTVLEKVVEPILSNGWYFYREGSWNLWKLTWVQGGRATGPWLVGEVDLTEFQRGSWVGPCDEKHSLVQEAKNDSLWMLQREMTEREILPLACRCSGMR